MTIKNLRWELETTFSRKQVLAMSALAQFVGNIEADLTKGFPRTTQEIDWQSVREVMTLFAELGRADILSYKALCQTVVDVSAGKYQLLNGIVVPIEKKG